MRWKLHSAQKIINQAFVNSPGQLFVGNCSRQFGKTFWAVSKAVEQAQKKKKAQIRYGAAFHTDLTEYIIPAFDLCMEDCPDSIKGKYVAKGSAFVFPNGSRIKLVGLDKNPNGMRGNALDLVIFDECGFVSHLDYIYQSVIIPATTHRPHCRIILISTPPSTPAHDFVDYVQRARAEDCYSEFSIFDNPMIDGATILRLMKETKCDFGGDADIQALAIIQDMLDTKIVAYPTHWKLSTTWRREYLCEFVTDSNLALVPEWKKEFGIEVERDEYYKYYHRYIAMDLGTKHFTAMLYGYYHFKKACLVIEDEDKMSGPDMNTKLLAGAIEAKTTEMWGFLREPDVLMTGDKPKDIVFRRISDNNNPHLLQDLSSIHDLHFTATSKEELVAMVNEVRLFAQAGRLIVSPKCHYLLGCLEFGVWTIKRDKFAESKHYGHFDHLAALVYLIRNLSQNTNPIPITHGHENHRSWLMNVKDQVKTTHNARVLSNALIPKRQKII